MKTHRFAVTGIVLASIGLSACATGYNPSEYSSGLTQQSVVLGRVISVQKVTARPDGAVNGGGLLGGIGGVALGSQVGHGAGTVIAEALGGIAGAVFGGHLARKYDTHKAVQVTVQEAYGNIIAVVESGKQTFTRGERVQVIYSQSGKVRVSPL